MTHNVIDRKPLTLGNRIRNARKEKRITINQIALSLDVDPRTVSRWQADQAMPSVVRLTQLANILGKSPGYFLDGEEVAA